MVPESVQVLQQLRVSHIAPAARAWLAASRPARVLGVFERACDLVDDSEEVLALVTSDRGLNPFALALAGAPRKPFERIGADSPVASGRDWLRIGPLQVDCRDAATWEARPDWPALRQRLAAKPGWLLDLAELAPLYAPPGSLLAVIGIAGKDSSSALPARARRGSEVLVAGLAARDMEACAAGVLDLAGLGGGLTPAGDDFILGVMLAAWAGLFGPGAEALCGRLAEWAAPRTTTLSGAYLRAAARGECAAYWHAVYGAILSNAAPRAGAGLPGTLAALLSVGHTSGADALAGFLAPRFILPERTWQEAQP